MNGWPDTEELLSRFRRWLETTRTEADAAIDCASVEEGAAQPAAGLYQLTEQFTALRHEVKLLTKTLRGGEERHEATLLAMQAAIEQFHACIGNGAAAVDSGAAAGEKAARPLVEGLIELDDALRRGRRVIENVRQQFLTEAGGQLVAMQERLEALYQLQPWWRRRLCRPWHQALQELHGQAALQPPREALDALLEGYGLIQNRLKRTLDEQAIIRMDCVGRQFDPRCMTVVETIRDLTRPTGLVIEEVRPGYYWKTVIFRLAEVKAIGEH